ncbi:MAG: hypothetical protein AAF541_07615 [Pseudomonadota bacterium]
MNDERLQAMANFQVLFNGEVSDTTDVDRVRENLARELGLNDQKAKQLFSGRTVIIRSQLDAGEAKAWQAKLAELGAVCRIKDLTPKESAADYKIDNAATDRTLRDLTAAHIECPRCSHMQLDSSHCARCGVDLEQAFKQKRKEDLLIEKKIRDLRNKNKPLEAIAPTVEVEPQEAPKKSLLGWLKRG